MTIKLSSLDAATRRKLKHVLPPDTTASQRTTRANKTAADRQWAFLQVCKHRHLPEPTVEYAFAKDAGRKWRADFCWIPEKIILESEGGVFVKGAHGRGAKFILDCEKYNYATVTGWRVLRVASHLLCSDETIQLVSAALEGP